MDEFEEKKEEGATTIRRVVRRGEASQAQPVTRVVVRRQAAPTPSVSPSVNSTVNSSENKPNQPMSASVLPDRDDEASRTYGETDVIKKTGSPYDYTKEKATCKYSRIILIGMPCSGKSSIGKAVAMLCGYEFIDMDEYVEKMSGMSIPEIFAKKDGENKFRELETLAAFELGEMENVVIATGGGSVTRESTMKNLHLESSFTVFIHRDFFKIATTPQRIMDKRPLFENTSFDALLQTYKTRIPLYRKYCNIIVENDKNREDAVLRIKEQIFDYEAKQPETK